MSKRSATSLHQEELANTISPPPTGRGSGHVQLGGNPEEDPGHTGSPFRKARLTNSKLKPALGSKRTWQKLKMKYHTCRDLFTIYCDAVCNVMQDMFN